MSPSIETALLFFCASVQVWGLGSLVCLRSSTTHAAHGVWRGVYLLALLAVGAACMFAVSCHSLWWVSCGATLAVMSICGTLDLGRNSPAEAL